MATTESDRGSRGATPNSRPPIAASDRQTAAIPAINPSSTGSRPLHSTSPTTSLLEAPSAVRMPISRVRSAAADAVTEYTPTTAKSSADRANTTTNCRLKRRVAIDAPTHWSMLLMEDAGTVASTAAISLRTAFAAPSGGPPVSTTQYMLFASQTVVGSGTWEIGTYTSIAAS